MLPGEACSRKNPARYVFNPENTYSVSFHSRNVDFFTWKGVNIPGGKDIDLKYVWGDLPARMVAYEIADVSNLNCLHTDNVKRYIVNYEVVHNGEPAVLKQKP